jgi:hypothetical protein
MTDTHIYCDRCGKELKGPYISQLRVLDYSVSDKYQQYDICPSCMRGLWNFMERRVLSYSDITKEDF